MQREVAIRSSKVTRSARGAECSVRFPMGICNDDRETSQWAHLNGAIFGKGMAIKAHDILGFHACSSCHAYYDTGHGTHPIISDETLYRCLLEAVCITYVRIVLAEVIFVPRDLEKPAAERPVKPRKPKAERKAIPQRVDPWPKQSRPIRSRNPKGDILADERLR